jgi:transposase
MGIAVWGEDEAGPYQTVPYAGHSWQVQEHPVKQPHEYSPNGTAKMLTLFHPATGHVRVKGVTRTTNAVLHHWLQETLSEILASLPVLESTLSLQQVRAVWQLWDEELTTPIAADLPPLRMILIMDNLSGHKTPALVRWLFEQGILPLYTPLGGSWLNMTESVQRILKRRALAGQHPTCPDQIISWLEATADGWNAHPTPFVWGGKRHARRERSRYKRYALGGSGACTKTPLPRSPSPYLEWPPA